MNNVLCLVLAALVSGCAAKVKMTVLRPAEINMSGYEQVAIGVISGRGGGEIEDDLTRRIGTSEKFKVLDTNDLLMSRDTTRTALITGRVLMREHSENIQTKEKTTKNKETGEEKTDLVYTRTGVAQLSVEFSVDDVITKENLATKILDAEEDNSTTSTNKLPSPIRYSSLYRSCQKKVLDNFMKVLLPYEDAINVSFEDDDKIPPLKKGYEKAKVGDWDGAIELFKDGSTNYPKSGIVHKAFYNLGMAYLYTDQIDEARAALEEARRRKPEKKYQKALEKVERRAEELVKLKEQGLLEE